MHTVEKVQRNSKIENCGPYAEAECLLFQPVVVLRPTAEGGEDPQLKKKKTCISQYAVRYVKPMYTEVNGFVLDTC